MMIGTVGKMKLRTDKQEPQRTKKSQETRKKEKKTEKFSRKHAGKEIAKRKKKH